MPRLLARRERCIGCHSCTVACKVEHALPPYPSSPPDPEARGPAFIRIVRLGPEVEGGRVRQEFRPIFCRHCQRAPCIAECPTGALAKDPRGLTVLEREKCIGCGVCIEACPFDAPQPLPDGTIGLCDLCIPLIEEGEPPACVRACPAGALEFRP